MVLIVTPDQKNGARFALMPALPRVHKISKEYDARKFIDQFTMPELWTGTVLDAVKHYRANGGIAKIVAYYRNNPMSALAHNPAVEK